MITAKHNIIVERFFRRYVAWILKKHFYAVNIIGDLPEGGCGLLMIGNHFSWWDGFFAFHLNNLFLHKRFHVMMLEEQLAKRRFFSWIGAFSVQPHSKEMLLSLRYASNLLENHDAMLVLYPQGKIETAYIRKIRFGKGVMRIWNGVEGKKPEFLLYVALVDYFSNRKPTLNLYLKPITGPAELSLPWLEKQYNDFYEACLTLQQESQ